MEKQNYEDTVTLRPSYNRLILIAFKNSVSTLPKTVFANLTDQPNRKTAVCSQHHKKHATHCVRRISVLHAVSREFNNDF
jgi:hypothetical protein